MVINAVLQKQVNMHTGNIGIVIAQHLSFDGESWNKLQVLFGLLPSHGGLGKSE